MLSARSLLFAFPTLMVVSGTFLVARNPEWSGFHSSTEDDRPGAGTMIEATADDENRVQIIVDKQKTANDLLNNRCSLVDATNRFLELNLQRPEATDNLRFAWSGSTDWMRALRQAVAFARALSRRSPGQFETEMHRIDEEAASLLNSERTVR